VIGVDAIEDAGYTSHRCRPSLQTKAGSSASAFNVCLHALKAEPGADHSPADLTVLFEVKIRQSI
jgi:hypothetical protein